MTILSLENPVILLLENMLEALSTAPDSINNERRRRRYLLNWLESARQMSAFRGRLRKRKIKHAKPVAEAVAA